MPASNRIVSEDLKNAIAEILKGYPESTFTFHMVDADRGHLQIRGEYAEDGVDERAEEILGKVREALAGHFGVPESEIGEYVTASVVVED